LVDDPIEGAAVAEAVAKNFGRDFGECERVVDLELGLVFGEPHFLDVVGEGHALGFDPLERPGFELFVVEVEFGQLLASFGEGLEVGRQRNPRQLAFEVIGELGAVAGMMQMTSTRIDSRRLYESVDATDAVLNKRNLHSGSFASVRRVEHVALSTTDEYLRVFGVSFDALAFMAQSCLYAGPAALLTVVRKYAAW